MRAALLALVVCAAVAGVLAADFPQTEIKFGNRNGYVVHPEYPKDQSYPLMLWYHGMGQYCPWQNEWCDKWQSGLRQRGIIIHCVALCANGNWDNGGNSDIDFTRTVINYMATNYKIDKSRVFVSGWSWGGMFISHMMSATGTSIAQGLSPHCCAYGVGNSPMHYLGYQSMYDDRCGNWVTNSWQDAVRAQGCNANGGNDRSLVCKGKQYELHVVPAGHSIMDYSVQGPEWMKRILGGSTPPPPADVNGCGATAAEGETLTLKCGTDEVISKVEFASYGTPTGDCSSGFVKSTCDANTTVAAVAKACVGQNKCSVVGSNDAFGDPCPSVQKHLAAKVTCAGKCGSTSAEGEALTLLCPAGKVIGSVEWASYGTPTGDCASGFTKSSCDANTTISAVVARCVGQNSCSVPGSNAVFGDPCPTVQKHLAAKVSCVAPITVDTTCAVAPENSNVVLGCVENRKITAVNFASYGSPTGTCPTLAAGTCDAKTTKKVVEAACVGKSFCSVAATNDLFSDPCSGTIKSLGVSVTCA